MVRTTVLNNTIIIIVLSLVSNNADAADPSLAHEEHIEIEGKFLF